MKLQVLIDKKFEENIKISKHHIRGGFVFQFQTFIIIHYQKVDTKMVDTLINPI